MRDKQKDLEKLAAGLDISPSMHKYAVDRYMGIAKYLNSQGLNANFYPQGSFRTGTVVRPIKDGTETDFDIDVICELSNSKNETTPKLIKRAVGQVLKESEEYGSKIKPEEDRCWTLEYANLSGDIGLVMDIVPCVHETEANCARLKALGVEETYADKAVAITERMTNENYTWQSSNPGGYGAWFDAINEPYLQIGLYERKLRILNENRSMFSQQASVEEVPDYYVRSPLQICIQILKRHRDLFYSRSDKTNEYRVASVIITTLAAQIAKDITPVDIDALLPQIINGMIAYVGLLQGSKPRNANVVTKNAYISKEMQKWIIKNPVDPEDNLADSWTDEIAQLFFRWVSVVKNDLVDTDDEERYLAALSRGFGTSFVEKTLNPYKTNNLEKKASPERPTQVKPTRPWSDQR